MLSCSQLFGEEDADQDVSPDTADPEAAGKILNNKLIEYKKKFTCMANFIFMENSQRFTNSTDVIPPYVTGSAGLGTTSNSEETSDGAISTGFIFISLLYIVQLMLF